jgi:hypothetical protein
MSSRNRRKLISVVIPLSMVLVAACEVDRFENEGTVCVGAHQFETEGGALEPGEPTIIRVMFPTCLNSCTWARSAECRADLIDGELVVTSSGEKARRGLTGPCTTECGRMAAWCETPSLPAGEYVLRHGDEMTSFVVPTTAAPCEGWW